MMIKVQMLSKSVGGNAVFFDNLRIFERKKDLFHRLTVCRKGLTIL